MDLTRARIELSKLERIETEAWTQLTTALRSMVESLPGMQRPPRALQPQAFDRIVAGFLHRTLGNPLLLGLDKQPLTRKTTGRFGVRRLARARMLVEDRSAEATYVVLELTVKARRQRWRVDQAIIPIVLSRHAMQRYLVRCGQGLDQLQMSLDVALLSIKAWLRAAMDHPDALPVSVAIPIESGAVLGLPYVFQACEPWSWHLECSQSQVRHFQGPNDPTFGVSLRTFIHENMYSDLQEEKLVAVKELGCELVSALQDQELSEDEALAFPTPPVSEVIEALFATMTDERWRSAFSCPARKIGHAILTYDR